MTNDEAYQWQLDRANKAEEELRSANISLELYRETTQKSTEAMTVALAEIIRLRQQVNTQQELLSILTK